MKRMKVVRARLALALIAVTLAGAARAETPASGFGLFAPDGTVAPAARETSVIPSFAEPPRTGIIVSGSGRFGLLYEGLGEGRSDVTVSTRLRVDLNVSHETDSGVVIGGRIRAQGEDASGTGLNAPQLDATWN